MIEKFNKKIKPAVVCSIARKNIYSILHQWRYIKNYNYTISKWVHRNDDQK